MSEWISLEKAQLFSAWVIVFVGLISIISAIMCLCRKRPDLDDILSPDQWQEALAERMAMTMRINGARALLEREQRERERRMRHEKCELGLGDAGTSTFERQAHIEDYQGHENDESQKSGTFEKVINVGRGLVSFDEDCKYYEDDADVQVV